MIYMVEITLPEEIDEYFMKRIPSHRAFINSLINEGKVQSYTINMERSKGWMLLNVKTYEEADQIMEQLPIYEFIRYRINEVMVHDSEVFRFPKMHFN